LKFLCACCLPHFFALQIVFLKQEQRKDQRRTNKMSNSKVDKSEPPLLENRHNFERWRIAMVDWLRRHNMWIAIFEEDEALRSIAKNRGEAFAALCQAMKLDDSIFLSDCFQRMRNEYDPDPRKAYDFILAQMRPAHIDAQINAELEIANLKIKEGESVPELITRYQMLLSRFPKNEISDEAHIRHIKRAVMARNEVYREYEMEIRQFLVSPKPTFAKLIKLLQRRSEELKYEAESRGVSSQLPTQAGTISESVNYSRGFHRGRSGGRSMRGRFNGRRSGQSNYVASRRGDFNPSGNFRGRGRGHEQGGRGYSHGFHGGRGRGFGGRNHQYQRGSSFQDHYRPYQNQNWFQNSQPQQNHPPPHRGYEDYQEKRRRVEKTFTVGEVEECVLFTKDDRFIIDSGCTSHMIGNLDLLESYELVEDGREVELADGKFLRVEAKGTMGPFKEVLYIPGLNQNLISVSQLDRDGCDVTFVDGQVILRRRGFDECLPIGMLRGKLYHLDPKIREFAGTVSERKKDLNLWHKRMAHVNDADLIAMVNSKVVDGLNVATKVGRK
jgi:hypothetical protein